MEKEVQSMIKRLLAASFAFGFFSSAVAGSLGTVCLGKNLSVVASDHTDRLYITIDDSDKIFFHNSVNAPRVVLSNLDLKKSHLVKVHFDETVTSSWKLDFSILQTDTVVIWRAKGAWRMESIEVTDCNGGSNGT